MMSAAKDSRDPGRDRLLWAGLAALGIVYGDIGTSPLYALRECFRGPGGIAVNEESVLGVLSMIFWALTIVISIKYLSFVVRADNRGEGGILALLALLRPWRGSPEQDRRTLIVLGLFGAALLYGDGMITPAISVLSAMEGLEVGAPWLTPYVIPATVVILIALFLFQKRGTAAVGAVFGPVMIVWFTALAVLGLAGIRRYPAVLRALGPWHALAFLEHSTGKGFLVLGAVFLVVTGGEALYADMGHFGARPIRLAWFALVMPALVANYFGQGAVLLANPADRIHPFYQLAPGWALYPLILLAAAATVIASQAVISGVFSLTRQAVQLGHFPRVRVVQTSSEEIGQIYVPFLNWTLAVAAIALVLGFRTSSNLAAAYGVAVSTTMVITTALAFFVTTERWRWPVLGAALVAVGFLTVDLAFFAANLTKILDGGWFPLAIGVCLFTVMSTWRRGRELLRARLENETEPLEDFLRHIVENPPVRVPGTGIFMTARATGTPPMLLHHLEHNQVLHERVILLTVVTEEVPRVPTAERLEVGALEQGFLRVTAHYGFMQNPNVPVALRLLKEVLGFEVDVDDATFYLGRETLIPTEKLPGMMLWREKLFAFLARNAARATAFYGIPPDRVVELGLQVEL
jgi:KUP system potassium uptake protein